MKENENFIQLPKEAQIKREERTAFLAQQGLTEEKFQETVQGKMTEGNLSFILAVYQTFDEFYKMEADITGTILACKKGCSKCCYTLITSTEMEIDEVIGFINRLPSANRIPLVKRIRTMSSKWRDYFTQNKFEIESDPFKVFRDWHDPCPLLGTDGSCEVYPVRIADCRTLTSLRPCDFPDEQTSFFADINTEGPVRYRLLSESWPTNLITKRLQEKMGLSDPSQAPVTPILHWLYLKRKEIG